jgi:acyl dehydratase
LNARPDAGVTLGHGTGGLFVDRSEVIGQPTGRSVITVERGPVSNFAKAVKDDSPVYASEHAAREAGFDHIPAPPTFAFCMAHWGTFPEDQPDDDPARGRNPVMEIIGRLMAKGGLVLHGEQEFTYHRPLVVGDRLRNEGKVVDLYEKESKGATMTFLVTENTYTDESGQPVVTTRMNLIHRG